MAHSQSSVEVALLLDCIVCVVDRKHEVRKDQCHMDSPVMLDPSCCPRLWMRLTGANGDTVEDMLNKSRCCLGSSGE